jgi:hypothetical protein
MDLLIKYAYPVISGYGKFTISFAVKRTYGEVITFTLGSAIPLIDLDGKSLSQAEVYAHISKLIGEYCDIYDEDKVLRTIIRVYLEGKNQNDRSEITDEYRRNALSSIIDCGLRDVQPLTARKIRNQKRSYPNHITALKPRCTNMRSFIVADTETILVNDVHKPYAAGLMLVRPGEDINMNIIDTFFSEDYTYLYSSFEERCTKLFTDFVCRIARHVKKEQSCLTIYFHNFSRFDGIFILKHMECHHKNYKLKPLMRNNRIYELAVYSGKKMQFRFRDSLNLLPSKLITLAEYLCPGLGPKGSIPYDKVNESNLLIMKSNLLDYMQQDIRLLGGVMQKAQEIYWKFFNIDIDSKITLASLALTIYRMKYYDASNWPIHIPNKNEDTFIRNAYYGGHTDAYKPYGENLYYYDVNSLYPYVMKEFSMPGGDPVWHENLDGMDLDSIFGFIQAYVECPETIKKPFLPYRTKKNTLIFPTGEFVGVYYSEE